MVKGDNKKAQLLLKEQRCDVYKNEDVEGKENSKQTTGYAVKILSVARLFEFQTRMHCIYINFCRQIELALTSQARVLIYLRMALQ